MGTIIQPPGIPEECRDLAIARNVLERFVRRQLLFPVNDNYFSLSTTITPEAAQRAAAGGGR